MSRFYFHVFDGKAVIDTVGVEFADLDAVRHEAMTAAGEMLSEGHQTWGGRSWQMVVTDEEGTVVYSVKFSTDTHGQ